MCIRLQDNNTVRHERLRNMKYLLKVFLMLGLLTSCNSAVYPHDPTAAARLAESEFYGEAFTEGGEKRELTLTLSEDSQAQTVFTLDVLYVGRSTRPTQRTGFWHTDGQTLTLAVAEQDGEPTDEDAITFQIDGDVLTVRDYDAVRYDFTPFILTQNQ